jgi:hypothetical protein
MLSTMRGKCIAELATTREQLLILELRYGMRNFFQDCRIRISKKYYHLTTGTVKARIGINIMTMIMDERARKIPAKIQHTNAP